MAGPQFQVTQQALNHFSEAIQQSGVDVVPRVMVAGNSEQGSSGNVMESLLTMLLSDRFSALAEDATKKAERSPEAEALRQQIYESMKNKTAATETKPGEKK
ncbi:MAG: hypothetical protein CO094_02965 [Anaerolineae bacterium CG_4_9_14_3_um_filter_57_17]|nr:hypothetical protein [bacterium]NCT21350.1 hypothetical protein [bacterium]OIO83698.1 MAG: hypothetical protein AUK01_11825 [Anaerolineae bacterium CG2_30_57_67]PJB67825.1 MAG: hypothetical protein CO094_02965 [Anaerolineae bacterium CG_4_9_14_3_um_filter_57_17]